MHPIIFQFGKFKIYSYSLMVVIAFFCAFFYAWFEAKRLGEDRERVIDFGLLIFVSAFVGARLLHILVNWRIYFRDPIRIFKFWEGGLVFYGGLILAELVCVAYIKIFKLNLARWADILAQEGKVEEALRIYEKLANLKTPLAGVALFKKALLLKDLKEYKEAVSFFKKAMAKGIVQPRVHFSLGYCLEKLGRVEEALSQYFKIVYLFDDLDYKVKAYFRIAKIYERENKLDEAKQVYQRITQLQVAEAEIAKKKIEEIEALEGKDK